MIDKNQITTNDELLQDQLNIQKEPSQNAVDGSGLSEQDIFAEQSEAIMGRFAEACNQHKIETAIAVAILPGSIDPIVFYKGHLYDVGALITKIKNEIAAELISNLR